jgi:hypothetical protein
VGDARTQVVGKRTIQGIEFEGTRIIRTAEGEPGLTDTIEQWYSDELELIGLLTSSGPSETYSARIQSLQRAEPDPALFTTPAEYKIIDLQVAAEVRAMRRTALQILDYYFVVRTKQQQEPRGA